MSLTPEAFHLGFCVEHAGEAEFLLQLRRRAVRYSTFDPDDLAQLDRRLYAHLQGLMLRPEQAWGVLSEQIESYGGRDLVALSGILALNAERPDWIARYLDRVAALPPAQRDPREVVRWIVPPARAAFVGGAVDWRPDVGLALVAECTLADGQLATWLPWLLERTLHHGIPEAIVPAVEASNAAGIESELLRWRTGYDGILRAAALSALLGMAGRHEVLAAEAWELPPSNAAPRLHMRAALRTVAQELPARVEALWQAGYRVPALECAGVSGLPALLPFIVRALPQDDCGKLAGLAFSAVTGLELPELSRREDEDDADDDASVESEHADRQDIAPLVSRLEPTAAEAWLRDAAPSGAAPLLDGHPVRRDLLTRVMATGFQYQRWLAAEVSAAAGAEWLAIDVEAPFVQQRRAIKAFWPGT